MVSSILSVVAAFHFLPYPFDTTCKSVLYSHRITVLCSGRVCKVHNYPIILYKGIKLLQGCMVLWVVDHG